MKAIMLCHAIAAMLLAAAPVARGELVAHYRFDGDLTDATGRHDGRPVDATLVPRFAPGRVGAAVVIERANEGIEAANPSTIDFSRDFTIAAWVNVGCYYAECPVVFKGSAGRTAPPDKFFGLFGVEGLQVHGEGQGDWITNFRASNGLVPNDGRWHHVAMTYAANESPHCAVYVDGQGKRPADKGTFRGGDFAFEPDEPGSVLRIGCRADGDTWRYVRSHLRGLLDELQIYDEALSADDIGFLAVHPGSDARRRDPVRIEPRFAFDAGHPWRPPFGVDRVGQLAVVVQFSSDTPTAPPHAVAAYRDGHEVARLPIETAGGSPFTARVRFDAMPAPDELVLLLEEPPGKPVERARWPVDRPAFEADAEAVAEPATNPVDLGAILPPADWLVLGPGQRAAVTVAAFSTAGIPAAEALAWFASTPDDATKAAIEIRAGSRGLRALSLPAPDCTEGRDTLHVAIRNGEGRVLWHKTIQTMLMGAPSRLPVFGAIETKLRYDYPLLSYSGPDQLREIPYDNAWPPERKDVVVALPNGSRFVFWRGAAYTPFWAGKHNTALNFEFAEAPTRKDGVDCVDAASDKELRRSRVEIIESTAARVHVRWTAQPCDLQYKVWGEAVAEDFYFYPDGFGSRTVTLQTEPKAEYEIEELLILTPPAGYPLRLLPEHLVDVLFRDGTKRELRFPILDQERDYEKLLSGEMPPVYRIRFHVLDTDAAVYFNPGWTRLPVQAYRPFFSQGQMVTPFYWGNHLPLARGKPTGHAIDDLASMTPAHNALMTWGHRRPQPLESRTAEMPDALGVRRPMQVETWSWLIGMTAADDARLLEWSRSFASPPRVAAVGATLRSPSSSIARRATLLNVERSVVTLTISPATPCVNPVFELESAPPLLDRIELDGRPLPAEQYAWDGRTLWLDATLRCETTLRLTFKTVTGSE